MCGVINILYSAQILETLDLYFSLLYYLIYNTFRKIE